MQRISVHIPTDLKRRINIVAQAKSQVEAEIIREALDKGLEKIHPISTSAQALLDFSKMAEKIPTLPGTPTDISTNHDYYAWGGQKKKKNG